MDDTIYLVTIETEDSEKYKYVFNKKPKEKDFKGMFFKDYPFYEKTDWKVCISFSIEKFEIIKL